MASIDHHTSMDSASTATNMTIVGKMVDKMVDMMADRMGRLNARLSNLKLKLIDTDD